MNTDQEFSNPSLTIQSFSHQQHQPLLGNIKLKQIRLFSPTVQNSRLMKQSLASLKTRYMSGTDSDYYQVHERPKTSNTISTKYQRGFLTVPQSPLMVNKSSQIENQSQSYMVSELNYGLKPNVKRLYSKKLQRHNMLLKQDLKKKGQKIDEDRQRFLYNKFFQDFFLKHPERTHNFEPQIANDLIAKYTNQFDAHKQNKRSPLFVSEERKRPFLGKSEGLMNQFKKKSCQQECDDMLNERLQIINQKKYLSIKKEFKSLPVTPRKFESAKEKERFRSINFEESLPQYVDIINKFKNPRIKMKVAQKAADTTMSNDLLVQGLKTALVPRYQFRSSTASTMQSRTVNNSICISKII